MTKIVDGYAQADIEATKGGKTIITFVETHASLIENALALKKSHQRLQSHRPDVKIRVVITKPKGGK